MNTISRKYYENPYLADLETEVTAIEKGDGGYVVSLKETIFYPTGGGQPHDTGAIDDIPVLDVFEKEGAVYHLVPAKPAAGRVKCRLDWPRRFDHMQQHTGQHLLSAVFQEHLAYSTESFHLGAEHCSIDLAAASLSNEQISEIEKKANGLILKNLPVHTYLVGEEELKDLPVRKMPPTVQAIRIVEIEGVDYSPCSGTHLFSTGQIGYLKILRAEKYKGMMRVYFLCGERAFHDYRAKHALTTDLVALLSAPQAELAGRVQAELEQKRALEAEVAKLAEGLLTYQAAEIASKADSSPLLIDLGEDNIAKAQQLAHKVLELGSFSLVITAGDRLVLAHNLPEFVHCGDLVKRQAIPLGGRGGGSNFHAQVYFPKQQQLQQFLAYLKKHFQIPS